MKRLDMEKQARRDKQMAINREVSKLTFAKKYEFYKMAGKYWIGGDDWLFAQEYALSLIKGFK